MREWFAAKCLIDNTHSSVVSPVTLTGVCHEGMALFVNGSLVPQTRHANELTYSREKRLPHRYTMPPNKSDEQYITRLAPLMEPENRSANNDEIYLPPSRFR